MDSKAEIEKLEKFLLSEYPNEFKKVISGDESSVDMAIRLLSIDLANEVYQEIHNSKFHNARSSKA